MKIKTKMKAAAAKSTYYGSGKTVLYGVDKLCIGGNITGCWGKEKK